MSRLFQLVNSGGPCSEDVRCSNSPTHTTSFRCGDCRLSSGGGASVFWWPMKSADKHPVLEKEKRDRKFAEALIKSVKKAKRDPNKIALLKQAVRAEQQTDRNIIHATKNSGRSNKDGDHVHAGKVTLDTKLQSTRVNPVVLVSQIDKVRSDAKRAGMLVGALVLRNQNGRGFVVMDEKDYARLVQ